MEFVAVIPARDEEASIRNVLRQCRRAGILGMVVVANGCRDGTAKVAREWGGGGESNLYVIEIDPPLGPDVPRALGTLAAMRRFRTAEWLVFIDGDWKGNFGPALEKVLREASTGLYDAWFMEYESLPGKMGNNGVLEAPDRPDLFLWRTTLQRLQPHLQAAAPSQLPMLVRRRAFTRLPVEDIMHPGLWFADCVLEHGIRVGLLNGLDPRWLGNPTRSQRHSEQLRETLIGDALEGCRRLLKQKPSRWWRGHWYDGYHSLRRKDLVVEAMGRSAPMGEPDL